MRRVSYAALIGLPLACAAGVFIATSAAQAEDNFMALGDVGSVFNFSKQREAYDYTERAPLVVPPTNTLPPPGSGVADAAPVNDPDLASRRRAMADSRRPVPPSDPGAYAEGRSARSYLVDPPSGLRDPRIVAAGITTDKTATASIKSAKSKHHHVAKRTPAPQETAAQ